MRNLETRRLEPAFQCAVCGARATWLMAGTSCCDYHRPLVAAIKGVGE